VVVVVGGEECRNGVEGGVLARELHLVGKRIVGYLKMHSQELFFFEAP
jgi:hypothetical protein